MNKHWKGSYAIETTIVMVVFVGIFVLLLAIVGYWYDRVVLESNAAVMSMSERDQIHSFLFTGDGIVIRREEEAVEYSSSVRIPWSGSFYYKGKKEKLHEADLGNLRIWKHTKGQKDEDK